MSKFLMFRNKALVSVPWQYRDPITGVAFGYPESPEPYRHFETLPDLVRAVHAHLTDNQKEVPLDLAYVVEDQICRSLKARDVQERPERQQEDGQAIRSKSAHKATVMQRIASATTTILAQMGQDWASHEEVGRRIRICKACPRKVNSGIGPCPTCLAAVHLLAKNRRHPEDGGLDGMSCGICDCFLSAKVHFSIEAVAAGTKANLMPLYDELPKCWVREGIRALPFDQQPKA